MTTYDYTYVLSPSGARSVTYRGRTVVWRRRLVADALPRGYAAADYEGMLTSLLPTGAAWSTEPGAVLPELLGAMASELARADLRANDLLSEADPRTTSELLPDWQRVSGLPDACVTGVQTAQQQRLALQARIASQGGQSAAYYMEYASRLGYLISVETFASASEATLAGVPFTGSGWAHTWRIHAAATTTRTFKVGQSRVGEPLRSWGNAEFECAMNHVKPAHTVLLFAYS